jgi:AcrR family transcriptional regulator
MYGVFHTAQVLAQTDTRLSHLHPGTVIRSAYAAVAGSARPPVRNGQRRAQWGSVSREQIVDAASAVIARDGFDRMTIRSVAAELEVAPMTLYHHVHNKDDLLDEVVDRELRAVWRPRASQRDWKVWTTEAAERFRRFLVAHPAAIYVYSRHPVVAPASTERMEAMLKVLRTATVGDDEALRAFGAIHTYTIGFAAIQAARDRWRPREDEVNERFERLAVFTSREQFMSAVADLLEGIEQRGGRTHLGPLIPPGKRGRSGKAKA